MSLLDRLFGRSAPPQFTPMQVVIVTLRALTWRASIESVKSLHQFMLTRPDTDPKNKTEVAPWHLVHKEFVSFYRHYVCQSVFLELGPQSLSEFRDGYTEGLAAALVTLMCAEAPTSMHEQLRQIAVADMDQYELDLAAVYAAQKPGDDSFQAGVWEASKRIAAALDRADDPFVVSRCSGSLTGGLLIIGRPRDVFDRLIPIPGA